MPDKPRPRSFTPFEINPFLKVGLGIEGAAGKMADNDFYKPLADAIERGLLSEEDIKSYYMRFFDQLEQLRILTEEAEQVDRNQMLSESLEDFDRNRFYILSAEAEKLANTDPTMTIMQFRNIMLTYLQGLRPYFDGRAQRN